MFFVLSKTLGTMLLPTNFLIELGLIAAVLLATRWARWGRRLFVVVIVLLAVCAFSPLGNYLLYPLESRFPKWDDSRGAPDGIVVLGGPVDADMSVIHNTPITRSAADRLIAAAALARRYPNARVLFTGGSANLISNDAKEGDFASDILTSLGVAKERLLIERLSRNTYENAIFSKQLVAPKPGERWLLVTSAYHMPRSVGLFRKAGFPVEPYPVDWRVGHWADLFSFENIALVGLGRTDAAVREWLGLLAYRLRDRTDQLLPGPDSR